LDGTGFVVKSQSSKSARSASAGISDAVWYFHCPASEIADGGCVTAIGGRS
jgi:hypothetical protein